MRAKVGCVAAGSRLSGKTCVKAWAALYCVFGVYITVYCAFGSVARLKTFMYTYVGASNMTACHIKPQ